jgi:cell division protein FtsW
MARKLAVDKTLFGIGIGLTLFGLVMVYSTSGVIAQQRYGSAHHFLVRQILAAVIGFIGMSVAMHIDYRRLLRKPIVYAALGFSTILLIGVLLVESSHNVHRWYTIGPIHVQPSEIAKIALVLYLAYLLAGRENRVNDTATTLLPLAVVMGQLAYLLYLEPDVGTAVLYVIVALVMLFLAGLRWKYVLYSSGAGLASLGLLIWQSPYRLERIRIFLDPESDPLGAGYQIIQSRMAFATGRIHGAGLGQGTGKLFYLPEPHTDFIFAVIGEELGLIGAVAVIVAFGVLFWRGVTAAVGAPDRGGYYLGMGITLCLVLQGMLNIGVALGLVPTTGVPLPFLSYGGSSLVVSMVALGMLLNVSQHSS